MSDKHLTWHDCKSVFTTPSEGILPDLRVFDTSLDDWQTIIDYLRHGDWLVEYREKGEIVPMPATIIDIQERADDTYPDIQVSKDGLIVIFRFYDFSSIYFDIDRREFNENNLDTLFDLMREIGERVGKTVHLFPEGGDSYDDEDLIRFDPTHGFINNIPPGYPDSTP